jgi:hypothetical protein
MDTYHDLLSDLGAAITLLCLGESLGASCYVPSCGRLHNGVLRCCPSGSIGRGVEAPARMQVWATNSLSDVDLQPTLGLRASRWGFQRRPPLKMKKKRLLEVSSGEVRRNSFCVVSTDLLKCEKRDS